MRARLRSSALIFALLALVATGVNARAECCPFCPSPTLTLSEQFAQADAVALVQWVSGEKSKEGSAGSTTFEILQIARDPSKTLEKGTKVTLAGYRIGKSGDLSLLMGSRGAKVEWGPPIEVTEMVFNYILQAPTTEVPAAKRLSYFMKFLEYPDPTISADAFGEFANAPYGDIVLVADKLPRDKLRAWVTQKDLPDSRLGLYGLLLGLCRNPEDAPLMEQKIAELPETQRIRIGIDGVMAGYLLLNGEKGIDYLEKTKISDKSVPFSETYAAMMALRFMWTYGEGQIPPARLQSAMRSLLPRPELSDIVIADLARWKDWSLMPKLMQMYDKKEYDIPSIKRAIIRYMIAAQKDLPKVASKTPPTAAEAGTSSTVAVAAEPPAKPQHAVDGAKHLEELRAKDPKMVEMVERFPG